MAKQSNAEIQTLTARQISEMIGRLNARRAEVTAELADIFKSRAAGGRIEILPPEDVRKARALAVQLLGGNAPASLTDAPLRTREQTLELEKAAIDIAIEILQRDHVRARAVEAVAWGQKHAVEWKDLCRQIVLGAHRLQALERRARDMRASIPGFTPPSLCLIGHIGSYTSTVYDPSWGRDFLGQLRRDATAQGVITEREARELSGPA
jgi:hypothetical protein